jgi:DNA polymerase III alpha subunit (gram-positive type)
MIKELVKESLVIVVSLSLVITLVVTNPLSAEDSNITNTTTTTSTVTSNNTNTNNNTNVNQSTSSSTNTNLNTNNTTINSTSNSTATNTNNNTSVVTSTVNQTQNVNNTSLITNNATSENTNLNTNNSTNISTNTNNNNNVSSSSSDVTTNNQNVNTNNNTSQNVNTNNSTSNSSQKVTQRVKSPPPSAVAPSIMSYSQDLCTTGASSAVQTQFFGVSTGRSVRDPNCERLKLSKGLYDMGMKVAAVALLCEDSRVWRSMMQAGSPCPYKGKIGEEARIAWEQNPHERPDWEEVKKELTGYEIKAYKKGDFCKKYPNHKICSG